MKNKILVLTLSTLFIAGCSSKKFEIPAGSVPPPVVTTFQQKYPDSDVTVWKAEKEDGTLVFEVKFKQNNKKVVAAFNPDGSFIKEE